MRRQTDRTITKIKTEIDEEENNRRDDEEKKRKERANKIQNEVITSHKKNVEIDWNWQELEEKEDCKELSEVIVAHLILAFSIGHRGSNWGLQENHRRQANFDQRIH